MIIDSYKAIKKHGLIATYKVKSCIIKKIIFALGGSILKKQFNKKNQNINIYKNKDFIPHNKLDINICKESAKLSAQNCFKIFGKIICFNNKIDWHIDFLNNKMAYQDMTYQDMVPEWKSSFYQNIKIKTGNTNSFNKLYQDIKIPWELSRLQHIPSVCIAGDIKTFQRHINSWIDNNPFLIGVNWVCPMDVAIRAINLINGFYLLKNNKDIDKSFWIKLINSLYDHAIYLENNFEIFYKPNNHYIADLLGFFYLCFLFNHIKHFQKAKIKTYKKILEQFDLQIQNDGTCYEGSTSYHKLITEMFSHFYYLCKKNNSEEHTQPSPKAMAGTASVETFNVLDLPKSFVTKLKKAQQFIEDCTDNAGNFVQIGDNDSGKILEESFSVLDKSKEHTQPSPKAMAGTASVETFNVYDNNKIQHYSDFGISIIKNSRWHITYRHPTFNKKQPTGHFHQDELSITFSYNGIPILVDPGSYLYTANKAWRNRMRSYRSHNNFYIEESEEHTQPSPKAMAGTASVETFNINDLEQQDLFSLNKNEQSDTSKISEEHTQPSPKAMAGTASVETFNVTEKENRVTIQNFYVSQKNIKAFRKLKFDNKITITDWWQGYSEEKSNLKNTRVWKHSMFWNLTFHPKIKLKKIGIGEFEIFHANKKIFHLKSNLNFMLLEPSTSTQKIVPNGIGYYSPGYRKIKECTRLFTQTSLVQTSLVQTSLAQTSIDHKKYVTILYPAKTQ